MDNKKTMKKLILLFITLTTFTNGSYASFPVMETTASIELLKTSIPSDSVIYFILGFFVGLLSWVLLLLPLLLLFVPNKKLKKGIVAGFLIGLLLLIGFLFSGEIFGYAKPVN